MELASARPNRPIFLGVLSLLLVACIGIDVTPKDAGATSSEDAGAVADAGIVGGDCIALGGATLCTATSMCPNVLVDHDVYPHCGFRIRGSVVDIQCLCDDMLCPLGSPSTCSNASEMLEAQSESTVCAQVNEGRCAAATTTGGSSSSGSSTCDKSCAAECANDPSCLNLCGC